MDFLAPLVSLGGLVERATRRPRIAVHFDWIRHTGSPILRFFFVNNGRRRETIVEVRFGTAQTPRGEGWMRQHAILERLPVTLGPHTASQHFLLTTDEPAAEFDGLLRAGEIVRCDVVTTARRGHTKSFPVPPLPS